jgi:uncharacterized protein YjbI with pentapeptide repeats
MTKSLASSSAETPTLRSPSPRASQSPRLGVWLASIPLGLVLLASFLPQSSGRSRNCVITPKAICPGADLSGMDLHAADLNGADLRGADLTGTDLENADLRGARLDEATMIGTDLAHARGDGASLRHARLLDNDMESARFPGADFSHAVLDGTDLESADLSGSLLEKASLMGSDLESANLRGIQADGADLTGANLSRAQVTHASLEKAQLRATNLSSTRLDGANLTGADLRRAHLGVRLVVENAGTPPKRQAPPAANPCFPMTSCSKAAISQVSDDTGVGALLVDTNLRGADLSHADLNGVVMLRGSLREAQLTGARKEGARLLDVDLTDSTCPDGEPPADRCSGLEVPQGSRRQEALARVAWLSALPWPWD